jgi:hypothetical protein
VYCDGGGDKSNLIRSIEMSKKSKKNKGATQILAFLACLCTAPPLVVTVQHSSEYDMKHSQASHYDFKLQIGSKASGNN